MSKHRFRGVRVVLATTVVLAMLPVGAEAYVQGPGQSTASITVPIQGKTGVEQFELTTGPGYWDFVVTRVEGNVRSLSVTVMSDCVGGQVLFDATSRSPGADAVFSGYAAPLPASWVADPDDEMVCVVVEAQGKRGSSVTVEAQFPDPNSTVWVYRTPSIMQLGEDHATLYVEGWSYDASRTDLTGSLVWYVDGALQTQTGGDVLIDVPIGTHFVSASPGSDTTQSAGFWFTVLDLDMQITLDPGPHRLGEPILIEVEVFDGASKPVEGATVIADVVTPKGWTTPLDVTDTGSDGKVLLQFEPGRRDGRGEYQLRIDAIYTDPGWLPDTDTSGYARDWSTTFTVVR